MTEAEKWETAFATVSPYSRAPYITMEEQKAVMEELFPTPHGLAAFQRAARGNFMGLIHRVREENQ